MSKHKEPKPSADSTTTPSTSTPSPDSAAHSPSVESSDHGANSSGQDTPTVSATTAAPAAQPTRTPTGSTDDAPKPSPLELDLLRHGRLTGRDRTNDLQRLNLEHGAEVVAATIAKLIKGGVLDAGQVLTPKGHQALTRFGG